MDVVLSVGGQVIVDDQGNLLDIDASGLRRQNTACFRLPCVEDTLSVHTTAGEQLILYMTDMQLA